MVSDDQLHNNGYKPVMLHQKKIVCLNSWEIPWEIPSSLIQLILQEWGEKNQLILSIHWYPSGGTLGHLAKVTVEQYVAMGKKESAELMASSPIWVSEFCSWVKQGRCRRCQIGTECGSDDIFGGGM